METPKPTEFYTWRAEPTHRGTFGILVSCIVTLTLCVWTAVHLNIPAYQKSSHRTFRKVAWLFAALFAPEVVALIAFLQWREAGAILKSVEGVFSAAKDSWYATLFRRKSIVSETAEEGEAQSPNRQPWGSTHSFYGLMGGFAVDVQDIEPDPSRRNRRRMILSPLGLKFIMKYEPTLLPDLSEQEIRDKSKANNLAKTVVCIQALWFCLQCLSRWHAGLTVTLLELNTLAHCLCALLIFVLWWNKPLDVEEPSLINSDRGTHFAALMSICSYGKQKHEGIEERYPYIALAYRPGMHTPQQPQHGSGKKSDTMPLLPGEALHSIQFLGYSSLDGPARRRDRQMRGRRRRERRPEDEDNEKNTPLYLDDQAIRCWRLASEAMGKYRILGEDIDLVLKDPKKRFLVDRNGDIPDRDNGRLKAFTYTLVMAGILYGGIHLVAWNNAFRSMAEEWLWKGSALLLTLSGPVGALIFIMWTEDYDDEKWGCGHWINIGMFSVFAFLYLACRVALVVESFMNLFHLPETAFQVPRWTQYMPHIS